MSYSCGDSQRKEQKRKHERSVSILKQQSDVEAFRTEHCVGDVIAVKSRQRASVGHIAESTISRNWSSRQRGFP